MQWARGRTLGILVLITRVLIQMACLGSAVEHYNLARSDFCYTTSLYSVLAGVATGDDAERETSCSSRITYEAGAYRLRDDKELDISNNDVCTK